MFDSSAITTEVGKSTTISVPQSPEFSISDGKQAKCQFVYSTINLAIAYTATAFLFDADGATAWVTSFAAEYQAASYTNIETVVTFTNTGGRAGELSGAEQLPARWRRQHTQAAAVAAQCQARVQCWRATPAGA